MILVRFVFGLLIFIYTSILCLVFFRVDYDHFFKNWFRSDHYHRRGSSMKMNMLFSWNHEYNIHEFANISCIFKESWILYSWFQENSYIHFIDDQGPCLTERKFKYKQNHYPQLCELSGKLFNSICIHFEEHCPSLSTWQAGNDIFKC